MAAWGCCRAGAAEGRSSGLLPRVGAPLRRLAESAAALLGLLGRDDVPSTAAALIADFGRAAAEMDKAFDAARLALFYR